MKRRLLFALILAAFVAALAVIWIPGCGYVDTWFFWTWECAAAGGGAGGAG